MPALVVFDFDRTLSAEEIGQWHDRANMTVSGFGGSRRLTELARLLRGLQRGGCTLGIVSYNSKTIISAALAMVGLAEFFDPCNIHGREAWAAQAAAGSTAGRSGWSKPEVILKHLVPHAQTAQIDLLFTDDNPSHCRDVEAALPGATVVQAPRPAASSTVSAGLQAEHMETIRRWARARGAYSEELSPGPQVERMGTGVAQSEGRVLAPMTVNSVSDDVPCTQFAPKMGKGPLSRYCRACGAHASVH